MRRLTRQLSHTVAVGAASASAAVPRVLCLHGGGTNAAIMRAQTTKLRVQLRGQFDFEFLEGAWPFEKVDPAVRRRFDPPYLGWYDVEHDDANPDRPYVETLLDERVRFTYPGVEEAMARVEEHIESTGPYSTLLGFSQGAILITLLTALRLERARAGLGAPPTWAHNVLVCGMPVRANEYLDVVERKLDFPCTIAQGRRDPAYRWCIRLADAYAPSTRRVIEYADGHRFPHSREDTAAIADCMRLKR